MKVAVLGASPKVERYSNRAIKMLRDYGHEVFPVNPAHSSIENLRCYSTLSDLPGTMDTLTVYVGPVQISSLIPEILAAKPKRVILNPGAESSELMAALNKNKIPYEEACTLVLLQTKQF